mgnify:CR=1 FL=1|jgi:hypothetical protein
MSKHNFSQSERFAVFSTHGAKCYMCCEPVNLQTMHVDHIIPESLQNDQARLEDARRDFKLPEEFDLNSYENWLPSCGPCNISKGSKVFRITPLVQMQVDKAGIKANKAREFAKKTVVNATLVKCINTICRASEDTKLTHEHIELLINSMREHNPTLFLGAIDSSGATGGSDKGFMGLMIANRLPVEIGLTPFHKIVVENKRLSIVSTPYGTGYVPKAQKGATLHPSFYCGNCGSLGPWNGARCLSCGHLNDD